MYAWLQEKGGAIVDMVPWHTIISSRVLLHIVLIVAILGLGKWFLHKIIRFALVGLSIIGLEDAITKKHSHLIENIVRVIGNIVIYGAVLLLVLGLFDFNVMPVLVGAGFAGIMTGIVINSAAQPFLRDLQTWFRILRKKQYHEGEEITIAGIKGTVKKIDIELTELEDADGNVVTVPTSAITTVTNHSRKKEVLKATEANAPVS